MKLDVICATYNRAELLRGALDSFAEAARQAADPVRIIVVDNNSADHTREVAEAFAARWAGPLLYLFEPRQGKHNALNLALSHSDADLVGYFDDDERVVPDWIEVGLANMADPQVDYIGGPVRPDWDAPPPDWLPQRGYGGVLGLVENGAVRRRYGEPGFQAMLTGANCFIRKPILDACGPYLDGYLYAEDRYMWNRLQAVGARGWWVPELVVYAKVPTKRLTKDYYRRWAFQEGRTIGKEARGQPGALLGAPRWLWGEAARALATTIVAPLSRTDPGEAFQAEMDLRKFAGYYAARNLPFISERYYSRE